ncbi:F-box protein-like [Iris pallida]|uniref:F-box protein-like n=1 Tax=Iris pallida TaxID=29817 RepID=A0AAX6F639_IRIPA|nr:F-box protein-like [Iris pallida]
MEHENKRCEGKEQDELHLHQQQQHQNRFYDEIEAQHCAASNPTRLDLVAKVKPKPKPPVAVDFPFHVLILILARLPAKTLLKFRCVCKSWNSLIQQDHHFISLHQLHLSDNNKKSPPPLVKILCTTFCPLHGEELDCIINYSSSSSSDTTTPYKIDIPRHLGDRLYSITNSCNGLLGLYSSDSFFIVNPTIRKLRPLPMTCDTPAWLPQAALGFDASTGVYKAVRFFDRDPDTIYTVGFGCEVCYLGGGGSEGWKPIDDPPVQPYYDSLPVVVDGAIIWASETIDDREVVALSFDLREEKFSVILHPEVSSRPAVRPKSHVFASEGRICVADEIPTPVPPLPYMPILHLNIWLLMKEEDRKKNHSNKWVKQYVVDLTYILEQIGPFSKAQPLITDHNGRIVISWGRQGRKHYYDPRTGSFDKHELDASHVDVEEKAAPYTESMVWPWPS